MTAKSFFNYFDNFLILSAKNLSKELNENVYLQTLRNNISSNETQNRQNPF